VHPLSTKFGFFTEGGTFSTVALICGIG